MCRFTFYRGEPIALSQLLTDPQHSLIRQSFQSAEREEPLNGDGFGLAWYVDGSLEPALFRSVTPAWSNRNLRELARVTKSGCVLAHVRAATQGLVSEANCHPFKRGRYTLMHNGDVGGFDASRRAILNSLSEKAFQSIEGTTDSEHLFALFLDEMERAGPDARGLEVMAEALERAIDRALDIAHKYAPGEPSYLNLVVSDGECAIACRYVDGPAEDAETLYVARGRYRSVDGRARVTPAGPGEGGVLVSSERLGDDPAWDPVPVGSWLMIPPTLELGYRPMRVGPSFEHAPRPLPPGSR